MKLSRLLLAAACALAASAAPAAAQPELAGIVRTQLDSAVVLMRSNGFVQQGTYRGGALGDDANEVVQVDLQGGQNYLIMAVCDQDCSDLDLNLVDASGASLDSDYEPDDVPMVVAEVSRTGTYQLTVGMAECSVEPCGYGVAVFAQRQ